MFFAPFITTKCVPERPDVEQKVCYGLMLINANRYHSRKKCDIKSCGHFQKKTVLTDIHGLRSFFELDHSLLPSTICLATAGCGEQLGAIREQNTINQITYSFRFYFIDIRTDRSLKVN
jgi:hypothetical protein